MKYALIICTLAFTLHVYYEMQCYTSDVPYHGLLK